MLRPLFQILTWPSPWTWSERSRRRMAAVRILTFSCSSYTPYPPPRALLCMIKANLYLKYMPAPSPPPPTHVVLHDNEKKTRAELCSSCFQHLLYQPSDGCVSNDQSLPPRAGPASWHGLVQSKYTEVVQPYGMGLSNPYRRCWCWSNPPM
jgi:hypothetical protein